MSKHFDKMDIEQLVQAALREKSWNKTIFKIMAGRINVSICNMFVYNLRHYLQSLGYKALDKHEECILVCN